MVRHGACGDKDAPTGKTNDAVEDNLASSKTGKSEEESMAEVRKKITYGKVDNIDSVDIAHS